jgi:hypothetical protein
MADDSVIVNQVNVVVSDVAALVEFLEGLGLEMAGTLPEWMRHHRTVKSTVTGLDADLDSSAFAAEWGGLPPMWTGVVLGVRVPDRATVDTLYERAVTAGAIGCRAPYDTFWGSRYATVEGPNGIVVGLMSPATDAAIPPPEPPG